MSNERTLSYKDKMESYKRAKEQKLCRQCGEDVKRFNKRCRTFCGPECVHAYLMQSDTNYVRDQVFKRDKGVCAHCGLDCTKWFEGFKRWVYSIPHIPWNEPQRNVREHAIREYFHLCGMTPVKGWSNRTTWWDADHIHPVAEGGGLCGLENYQTLCVICHRRKTSRQLRKVHTTS